MALTQTFLLFLCAESTDDDKVVTWHWEEVKGPLREEKVSADTPILTLTNLVPGNYTFRWGWRNPAGSAEVLVQTQTGSRKVKAASQNFFL